MMSESFTEHDRDACAGVPSHRLDAISEDIIHTVTHGRRVMSTEAYARRITDLKNRVDGLTEVEKRLLWLEFGMGD